MLCPACGQDNPAEARFCMACAQALGHVCPSCGAEAPAQARFCMACAAPLLESSPA
ncbi:MAG: zinc-ribbon domain-containing protein, partial [Chloroflexi bacterium]|nr:zinc-ribbon domain-containing protein [Chloroflexota bacterium]